MQSLVKYLDCGVIELDTRGNAVNYSVLKFSDIVSKIIPFFKEYPIIGIKSKYFEGFCMVAEMMKNKVHLTAEGFEKIKQIKSDMDS